MREKVSLYIATARLSDAICCLCLDLAYLARVDRALLFIEKVIRKLNEKYK